MHFWFFLAWLEASFQEELDPGNVQHEEHARNLVVQLVQQLESKAVESGDFLTKNKLEEIISSIKVSKVIKKQNLQAQGVQKSLVKITLPNFNELKNIKVNS